MRGSAAACVAVVLLTSGCGMLGDDGSAREPSPPSTSPVATPSSPSRSEATPQVTPTPTPSSSVMSWASLFRTFSPVVVRIATTGCDDSGSLGSGFAIDDKTVVTAAHVVDKARTISLQTPRGGRSQRDPSSSSVRTTPPSSELKKASVPTTTPSWQSPSPSGAANWPSSVTPWVICRSASSTASSRDSRPRSTTRSSTSIEPSRPTRRRTGATAAAQFSMSSGTSSVWSVAARSGRPTIAP